MRTMLVLIFSCLLTLAEGVEAADKGLAVKNIRFFSYPGFTRIVFEVEEAGAYVLTRPGDGRTLQFSSYGGPFTVTLQRLPTINDGVVKGLEHREDGGHRSIIITLGPAAGEAKDFVLRGPDRIVVDVLRGTALAPAIDGPGTRQPVIVIDPGHGGENTGLVTGQGTEKALMLDLANVVRRELRKSGISMTTYLTREQDRALTLDERAASSNAHGAIVHVSLHAAPGSGGRVYILDPDEGQIIRSSGASSDFLQFDTGGDQQQMLWGTQQAGHASESGRLGRAIARALSAQDSAEPEQAPLAQLRAVDAAAVVVEIGMGMNRAKAADAIARGIEQYVREKR